MPVSQPRKGSTPSKVPFGSKPKASVKRNNSLLNFFQKADGPPQATSSQRRITQFVTKVERSNGSGSNTPGLQNETSSGLFLEDKNATKLSKGDTGDSEARERRRSRTPDDIWGNDDAGVLPEPENERYNESELAIKRRKVDSPSSLSATGDRTNSPNMSRTSISTKDRHVSGPFIDESDSEDDLAAFKEVEEELQVSTTLIEKEEGLLGVDDDRIVEEQPSAVSVPTLVREATSHIEDDEYADFDDIEGDEFRGEEEFLDPFQEEEERAVFGVNISNDSSGVDETPSREETLCPICQVSLTGLAELEISVHVNDCLDGKPSTAQSKKKPDLPVEGLTRFERAAIARPAQRDPYPLGSAKATSAFSKLMAGNAEDAAWMTAAAGEIASRGKQAYQRTCPFYKIIPGFSVCVDAFRYGAVEGCSAYFLSHFHSDHYIGLTASWRHGPIYCSKATGNLVRQQLKVNPKWVVDLEFEKKTEVPDTGGVQVTLIHANHCPGSALFLFEKPTGSGPSMRVQRILHCGDFRASPTHVQHALLRPETDDPITGQRRQQKIDVCYLDTTYLSPKYAFPSQEDVIAACADLCANLHQGQDEGLGQTPRQKGEGESVVSRFFSAVGGSRNSQNPQSKPQGRLLVVIGTYSIGKERICLGIARALKSKIYATAAKQRVCACLEDAELSSLLTEDPLEAQVHMQTLFEIRAETLADYLDSMKPHFSRVVGFRPTGWTYRPPAGRILDNPPVSTVLHSPHWKTPFSVRDMAPQRGSTRESACYGVPYSEHSSFRELTMFCCALRIGRVIPTVNVGSQKSRERMKAWIERWQAEKRKSGLYQVEGGRW